MKDKKLIILYVLMLLVGIALLFTKPNNQVDKQELKKEEVVIIKEEPKQRLEKITIAHAKHDINARTIVSADDYVFRTIEIDATEVNKNRYVLTAKQIEGHVAKNNITKDTMLEFEFFAAPSSYEYLTLTLREGSFVYPFKIAQPDSYLFTNLKNGDLVDLYVFYGEESSSNRSSKTDVYVSPSRSFIDNRLKPLVVGKRVLLLERNVSDKKTDRDIGQIQLELSNQEIKLLSTLMLNSKIFMYPSNFSGEVDDGLQLLGDGEKNWPLSNKNIFSPTQINKLRGN